MSDENDNYRTRIFEYVSSNSVDGIFVGTNGTIREATGCTRQSISEHLARFTKDGILERLKRACRNTDLEYRVIKTILPAFVRAAPKMTLSLSLVEAAKELWEQGFSGSEVGNRLGITKSSVISMGRRYGFTPRPSPINPGPILTEEEKREKERARGRRRAEREKAARAERPKIVVNPTPPPPPPVMVIKPFNPPSPFSDRVYRLPTPVSSMPIASAKGCCWPMWNDRERPTHVYCDAVPHKVIRGDGNTHVSSWCHHHHSVAFPRVPRVKAPTFQFGWPGHKDVAA